MHFNRSAMPLIDRRPDSRGSERADGSAHQRLHPPRLEADPLTGLILESDLDAAQPADGAERSAEPVCSSVLCGIDRSANARAARDQAKLLASPGGTVELVPAPELTHHGHRALNDRCEGHDLLVLGASDAARAAVEHTPIPILIARWSPVGVKLTDTILVPIDDSPASRPAVELAGRVASVHGGTIDIMAAPPRDPAFQRAIAATSRILLRSTGAVPRRFNEQLPPERAIPSAAAALPASLLVLGAGSSETARRMTMHIADCVGCSVLVVPALGTIEEEAERPRIAPTIRRHVES
jgi:nucleotide-binding universal stress UspA family protein